MKSTTCLIFFVTLVLMATLASSSSYPRRVPSSNALGGKRGFRLGAGDRFSHGFGKRFLETPGLEDVYTADTEESGINVDSLAELLYNNPELLKVVLSRYFDTNGDGVISRQELMGVPK